MGRLSTTECTYLPTWSVLGNGENTTKRRPGLEHPGRNEARPEPPDWIVRA